MIAMNGCVRLGGDDRQRQGWVSGSRAQTLTQSVAFDYPLPKTPLVTLAVAGWEGIAPTVAVQQVSPTGFEVVANPRWMAAVPEFTLWVNWIATL